MKNKQPSKKEKHEYEPLPCDKQVSYFLCLLGGWIFDLIVILMKKGETYYT